MKLCCTCFILKLPDFRRIKGELTFGAGCMVLLQRNTTKMQKPKRKKKKDEIGWLVAIKSSFASGSKGGQSPVRKRRFDDGIDYNFKLIGRTDKKKSLRWDASSLDVISSEKWIGREMTLLKSARSRDHLSLRSITPSEPRPERTNSYLDPFRMNLSSNVDSASVLCIGTL